MRSQLSALELVREMGWLGYTTGEIAVAAGCPVRTIEGLYDTPSTILVTGAVRRAWRKLGPPDIDLVAVQRVVDGDLPPEHLSVAERREAVRLLYLSRQSHREIAEKIHIAHRSATRILTGLGLVESGQVTG